MTANIYTALNAVMADVGAVGKNDRNQHQGFKFRGIDAVVNAVSPSFRKHGIIPVPTVEKAEYAAVATTNNKPASSCRLEVTYTFYAPDGSNIAATVASEAWDHGDKATPKAMSVAFRTALLQVLALPTDDPDPDEHVYVQAPPDWQGVLETAEQIADINELRRHYTEAGIARAPKQVREQFTIIANGLKPSAA